MAAGLANPKVAMHCGHHVDAVSHVQALQSGDHLHIVQVEVVEEEGEDTQEHVPDVGLYAADFKIHHLDRIQ